jgi:uncharacterized repeat protein (TIGR03803 family)
MFSVNQRLVSLSLGLAWFLSACGGGSSGAAPTYTVGGTISGLANAANVVLQNAGGSNVTVSANGNFSFPTRLANTASYSITVLTQPVGETCSVTAGTGVISGASVASVRITCIGKTFSISGTVSGLASGGSVTLHNTNSSTINVNANGSFGFSTLVSYGGSYLVTVARQPPAQLCTVTGGVGSATANVSGVTVTCVAATESVIHSFGSLDGAGPQAAVIQGSDGNFYGTTRSGGTSSQGTVFKISASGTETVIHSFAGGATDGGIPTAALIQGSDGNFYGTTSWGGPNNNGTVFRISPTGVETVLYFFAGSNADGSNPQGSLIQGTDGNLYGTTFGGGISNWGTVFKLTLQGVESVLHSFTGGNTDGMQPGAALIQGSDGNFYGTTANGGPSGGGTVFRITPSGVESVLHFFTFLTADASIPYAALIEGADGNLYGTSNSGGPGNAGTIFKITPAGLETVIYSFVGGVADGQAPFCALVLGKDGNFYGTTHQGGPSDDGTVFKITPSGVETVLHSFAGGSDGSLPLASLIQGSDGNLYSTTTNGGASQSGSLFKITPTGTATMVYSFNSASEGQNPLGLIQGTDGNFYGAAANGGTHGYGTVFMVTPTGVETVLHSFSGGTADGSNPGGALIQGSGGNFYGTTSGGGANFNGTVFTVTPAGVETVLYSFAGAGSADAVQPQAAMIQASDGSFYSTTITGGIGNGAVFKITPAGVETVLYAFSGGTTDGAGPQAALIQGSDGDFYGTTANGGTGSSGTVFKITSTGVESVLHSFVPGIDGSDPVAALIQGTDGNFYGTTASGGTGGSGTVFKISPTGAETVLYSFAGGTTDGSVPSSALTQGSDGNFYGTTAAGGTFGAGTVFKITATGVETVLYSFAGGTDGRNPRTPLTQGADGMFYGTTNYGGSSDLGTAFRF